MLLREYFPPLINMLSLSIPLPFFIFIYLHICFDSSSTSIRIKVGKLFIFLYLYFCIHEKRNANSICLKGCSEDSMAHQPDT